MRSSGFRVAAFSAGLLVVLAALLLDISSGRTVAEIARESELRITERIRESADILAKLPPLTGLSDPEVKPDRLFSQTGIGIYAFRNDKLIYWNNARLPFTGVRQMLRDSAGIIRLPGAICLYTVLDRDSCQLAAVSIIRHSFDLQNRYLTNGFESWTGIPEDVALVPKEGEPVYFNGKEIFRIGGAGDSFSGSENAQTSSMLFLFGLFLCFASLLSGAVHFTIRQAAIASALVLAGRALMIAFSFPAFLYANPLYDVSIYGNADSLVSGFLGDIVLNAVSLLLVSVIWMKVSRAESRLTPYLFGSILALSAGLFNGTASTLITNSTLSFDFLGIFSVSPLAFAGLASLGAYSLCVLIAARRLWDYSSTTGHPRSVFFIAILIAALAIWAFGGAEGVRDLLWIPVYGLLIALCMSRSRRPAIIAGVHVVFMSALTSLFLVSAIQSNHEQEMEVIALRLGERKDPVLESEYRAMREKIRLDSNLINLMNILPETDADIKSLLSQKYFNGYFGRYNLEYALFDKDCSPMLTVTDPVQVNEGLFEDQIYYNSDSSSAPGLYFIRKFHKSSRYLARVELPGHRRLYVFMEPKPVGEAGGFPDLLLDQSQQRHERMRDLSYAVYRNGALTTSFGAFQYPLFLGDSIASDETTSHRSFNTDDITSVIISTPHRTVGSIFTYNSYITLFFSLTALICYVLYKSMYSRGMAPASLTRRVQVTIVALLLLAITSIAVMSGRLVTRQFDEENRAQLTEKTGIITAELLSLVEPGALFIPEQRDMVNLHLVRFARLFKTDISLFTPDGRLFNTSQPRLYSLGLAAELANPFAVNALTAKRSPAHTVNEKAGSLRYLSHYSPIFSSSGSLHGYINLPYFARQSDLVNELSGIISAFINVYVILLVLSLLAGLLLSGYITRPLRMMQQQLSRITLGSSNEKIEWQTNDEIGRLVEEYNNMLAKLDESATLLARSERESAWREMAKQVAHEIRNPLTPMKLNLQYLQHLSGKDPAEFRKRFMTMSDSIIGQIDALATIASEFSSLARLPGSVPVPLGLSALVAGATELWKEHLVLIRNELPSGIMAMGDTEQCLRVFNNIFKNAVQALEGREDAAIRIYVSDHDASRVIIAVEDNGPGIPDEIAGRIFTPSFTTKSTGSGLGLAMVRNIMEGLGGSVTFSSQEGKGTTFYVGFRLPS